MASSNLSAERPRSTLESSMESGPAFVFQPQKLKEVVEVIDLMGTVALRIREDSSGDLGSGGGGTSGQGAGQQTGTSARDDAIASAPPMPVMQKKLVEHLELEVATIERQAKALARSNSRGSAFLLSELYRKLRRLSSLISEILHASADVIKRFYVSVFIDHQPLVVTGGTITREEE